MEQLPNIGPTVAARLREAGIETRGDLERCGALEAYRRLRAQPDRSTPVRHYLLGLEAALIGLRVSDLPRARRVALLRSAWDLPEAAPLYAVRPTHVVRARRSGRKRR